jgi:hypothetical protein
MALAVLLALGTSCPATLGQGSGSGACISAMDCALNGDCVGGVCACDAAWSGSPACDVVSFDRLDKAHMPGYYNNTESSWGGFPIEDGAGGFALVHAQMANSCGLGTWSLNSIVGLSRSSTGRVEGPYEFAKPLLPHFAHNPTIRRAADGTYIIYFIGGWNTTATDCRKQGVAAPPPTAEAAAAAAAGCNNVTYDAPDQIRVGADYATKQLALGATIAACAASCCADSPRCRAFSFNTDADPTVPPVCKHKGAGSKMVTPNTCSTVRGAPNCLSGALAPTPPQQTCDGRSWPKSCGPNMPGPSSDCCGPASSSYNGNSGCGIAMASAKTLDGPWTVLPLRITDQFDSDEVYCAHTNPSPVFGADGSVTIAFNAGFCRSDHLETIGVAHAPSWEGPYTLLSKSAVLRNPDGSPHKCEDPHLWRDGRGWHLLTHNQQGPQGVSSYGYSLDAKNWTLSPTTPYDCTIHYTDGSSAVASGCGNRPQFVFSDSPAAGGKPKYLINGATAAKPQGGAGTWTLFRKVSER